MRWLTGCFAQALVGRAENSSSPISVSIRSHTYDGNLDKARSAAEEGLRVRRAKLAGAPIGAIGRRNPSFRTGPARFALYTLKALAFIHLRRDEQSRAIRDS